MTGEWFDPQERAHQCSLPSEHFADVGKGWRCPCGLAYVLESVSQHGETWPQWRRAPAHDRVVA